MKISLIITTYNWKEALEAVLKSVFRQTRLPHEIIVGDDGSREDTKELIEKLKLESPVPLIHVWQEDEGFQLSRIRNKAIAAASGDYMILIDGDIVLEKHFIEDHSNVAEKGFFVQGGRVLTGKRVKEELILNPIKKLNFFSRNIKNRKNTIRSLWLSTMISGNVTRISGIRTCNFAAWKDDIISVNGFNEAFVGWGREDSEFVVRLMNKGVQRRNIKHRAIAYHLYHPENARTRLNENDDLLDVAIKEKLIWCDNGIKQYLENKSVT